MPATVPPSPHDETVTLPGWREHARDPGEATVSAGARSECGCGLLHAGLRASLRRARTRDAGGLGPLTPGVVGKLDGVGDVHDLPALSDLAAHPDEGGAPAREVVPDRLGVDDEVLAVRPLVGAPLVG